MAIKLGKLANQTINLKFPQCWQSLATILGLNVEYDELLNTVRIEIGLEDITITQTNEVTCTIPLTKEIISQIIMEAAKHSDLQTTGKT